MAKITISDLYAMKENGEKIVMITAYDALFAKIFDNEVDMVLVGDSLNMSFGGHTETIGLGVDEMIYHARAVRRALTHPYLVVDMPFCSCATPELALKNCAKVYEKTGCDAVLRFYVALQGSRYTEKDFVANVMSVGVIDGFEVINIPNGKEDRLAGKSGRSSVFLQGGA